NHKFDTTMECGQNIFCNRTACLLPLNHFKDQLRSTDGNRCVLWAIPLGRQRHYASALFAPGWKRVRQENALNEGSISPLPAIPTAYDLSALQLHEIALKLRESRPYQFVWPTL